VYPLFTTHIKMSTVKRIVAWTQLLFAYVCLTSCCCLSRILPLCRVCICICIYIHTYITHTYIIIYIYIYSKWSHWERSWQVEMQKKIEHVCTRIERDSLVFESRVRLCSCVNTCFVVVTWCGNIYTLLEWSWLCPKGIPIIGHGRHL